MKTILMLVMIFGTLSADCDYDCSCPDLRTMITGNPDNIVHEKGVGCAQSLVCTARQHVAILMKELSTFPDIEDEWTARLFDGSIPYFDLPIVTKEFVGEFGLVCENSTWFATKFPRGVRYGSGPYAPEVVNGKGYKARIRSLTCP